MNKLELFLEKKYLRGRGYFVCSKCQKVRDKKIIKELADIISDLSFYDYQKTIAKYKNKERNRYKHTIDRFKVVVDKDMRKMSNIVENLIRRYVESRV